jgi:hypothetical protein
MGVSRFRNCNIRLQLENSYVESEVFRAYSRRVPMFNNHGFVQRPGFFIPRDRYEAFLSATGRLASIRESFIYGVQLGLVTGPFLRVSSLSYSNLEPTLVLLRQTLRNNSMTLLALNLDNVFLSDFTMRALPSCLEEVYFLCVWRCLVQNSFFVLGVCRREVWRFCASRTRVSAGCLFTTRC